MCLIEKGLFAASCALYCVDYIGNIISCDGDFDNLGYCLTAEVALVTFEEEGLGAEEAKATVTAVEDYGVYGVFVANQALVVGGATGDYFSGDVQGIPIQRRLILIIYAKTRRRCMILKRSI